MNYNIGIIGRGFVGTAIVKGFAQFADTRIYDIDPKRSSHSFEEVISSDFVFLCLPTPMISAAGGQADLSILEKCIKDISEVKNRNKDSIFIIKSTVPVGTTEKLAWSYNIDSLVHCPEFLTARSALIDFICPARNIIGGEDLRAVGKVEELLTNRFPGTPCFTMRSRESEMVKYMANCFFATKIMFFNEMKLLTEKEGLDWNTILEGVISDGRIGTSHYEVPGHDGDMGFGGTCVLPDAKVKIRGEYGICTDYLDPDDIVFPWHEEMYPYREKTIEQLYELFHSDKFSGGLWIESCDYNIEKLYDKYILDVTYREIDEDIYVFETDNGIFECTKDHLMPVLVNDVDLFTIKAKDIEIKHMLFAKKEGSFDFLEINKIDKRPYKGKVYNLELDSLAVEDDLFWVEQRTGIVTHNCFPKDINALISIMEESGIDPLVLKAVWKQNLNVRNNRDWERNSSAVSNIPEN